MPNNESCISDCDGENNTILIIGLIKVLQTPDDFLKNIEKYAVGSVGLNSYYSIKKLDGFKYVRVKNDTP